MFKKLLKNGVFTLATAALLSTTVQAQTVIWGAGSTDTHADSVGRFIGLSTTSNQIMGWTSTDLTAANPNNVTIEWESSINTNSSYASSILGSAYEINSPSKADGVAFFNSWYFDTQYRVVPQHAQLTSEAFSLQGHNNSQLVLSFYASGRDYNTDSIMVAFSTDNGASWTNYDLGFSSSGVTNEILQFNIGSALAAATTDLTQCKIRFIFSGDGYRYVLDDIKISEQPQYDIAFSPLTSGTYLYDIFTKSKFANSNYIPVNQVNGDDFLIGARIINRGYEEIGLNLNPRLTVKVEHTTDNTNWTTKYNNAVVSTEPIPTDTTVIIAEYLSNLTSWVPDEEGLYRVTLGLTHDGTDASTVGDEVEQYFTVVEANSIYSKVDLSTTGAPYASNAYSYAVPNTSTGKVTRAGWGSMFNFPNGAQTALDSVTITLLGERPATGFTQGDVTASVYEFDINSNAATNDWSGDPFVDGTLRLVGTGTITVNYAAGYQVVSVPIINTDEERLVLANDKVYFVSIEQSNSTTGLSVSGTTRTFNSFFIGADTDYELGMNATYLDAKPTIVFSTERSASNTETTDWYNTGMGASILPSFLLVLSDSAIAVNEAANINNLSLFPNPAQEVLNVSVDLEQASDVQYIMTDISGRIVRTTRQANVMNETVTFNIEDLAAGVYTITVKSDKGVSTQKFVKK